MPAAIDDLDRNILSLLQQDATLPLDEIARRVGASKTPVGNRILGQQSRPGPPA